RLAPALGALPVVGRSMPLELLDASSNASVGFLVLGFTATVLELSTFGAPGCFQLSSAEATLAFLPSGPTTSLTYPLPISTAWIGTSLYLQAAMFAPGLNALGLETSNGLELVLGEY
ncbi:MAG: hypothetical protein KDE27_03220, partial [Planctomycetes bacterium]|nr:hypothetical protein [Planctomycetota bacterium]